MDLSKQLKALMPIFLFCMITFACAAEESDVRRKQLEKELGESQSVIDNVASPD
jgi:hypothetical protein